MTSDFGPWYSKPTPSARLSPKDVAQAQVVRACNDRAVALCAYAHTPAHARRYLELGYRVIGLCTDYILLARAARDALAQTRAASC